MNIYKELIAHEVFPALGCTEPIAVAYAAALAAAQLKGDVVEVRIEVDPGVFKNGFAVTVPNTGGEKGNLIAGALGALIARPELKMEILRGTNDTLLARARELVGSRQVSLRRDDQRVGLYIDVTVRSASGTARAVLEGGHTNLVKLEKNGAPLVDTADSGPVGTGHAYRERLRDMTVAGMIDLVEELNQDDLAYLRRGVEMNLALAEIGRSLGKVGHFISDLVSGGLLVDDVISKSKILTASASDARMAGLPYPAMASGGSGNQGIVASLVPYTVGRFYGVPDPTILKSIALSHLVNGYRCGRSRGHRLSAVGKRPGENQPGSEHPRERSRGDALRRGQERMRPEGGQLHGIGHPCSLHGPALPRYYRGGRLCRPECRGDHKEHEPHQRNRHVAGGRDHAGHHGGQEAPWLR